LYVQPEAVAVTVVAVAVAAVAIDEAVGAADAGAACHFCRFHWLAAA
jgi:hypothetical protein